jgi:hypothetical protein
MNSFGFSQIWHKILQNYFVAVFAKGFFKMALAPPKKSSPLPPSHSS